MAELAEEQEKLRKEELEEQVQRQADLEAELVQVSTSNINNTI